MNPPPDPLQQSSRAPHYADTAASQTLPRQRAASPTASIASLPHRRAINQSISNLYASTSSLTFSAQNSGSNTPTGLAASVFSSGANGSLSPILGTSGQPDEPRNLVLKAFAPHVSVIASRDVEELLAGRGFRGGFLQLLRPFGERIHGKVTIRNSVGASTTWDDYGIRFTGVKDALAAPRASNLERRGSNVEASHSNLIASTIFRSPKVGGDVHDIEELVEKHLDWAEMVGPGQQPDHVDNKEQEEDATPKVQNAVESPFYKLYFRRLVSALPMTPHETFSHPVACVLAIGSQSPSPIQELKEMYYNTNTGDQRLPLWVNNDFLRFYVLVHDEDKDDITKSQALYDQMRRNFGIHCHLLRLRSMQCVASDDESVRLPAAEWLSAAEELAEIEEREMADDDDDPTPYIFDSDVTALRTFIRELVSQSLIPAMERNCAHWNEQVVARRKGLGGRLMSLGKRFAFGSASRNASSPAPSSSSNYDSLQSFYRPDAPEAVMRKLADYAFMLRDFRLAKETYEFCRSDFESDKAWKYYAGACEMGAVSTLLSAQTVTRKTRHESVDKLLDAAMHSYINRTMTPFYALRSLAMGVELLKLRGDGAIDDAARWGGRIIEANLVGDTGTALFVQRIGLCYASRVGIGSLLLGARKRKAAFWTVMAADSFMRLGRSVEAEKCLGEARKLYGAGDEAAVESLKFEGILEFLDGIEQSILAARLQRSGFSGEEQGGDDNGVEEGREETVEEVSEAFDTRPQRRSIIMQPMMDPLGAMTEPLSPVKVRQHSKGIDDGFS